MAEFIKAEINKININLENFKALQKEEVTKIKKTDKNIEESQHLINKIWGSKEITGTTDNRTLKVIYRKCRAMSWKRFNGKKFGKLK